MTAPSSEMAATAAPESGVLRDLAALLRQFLGVAFNTYRPERHYMRGPGPACAARKARDA